jgi:acylphosphatase
MPDLIARQWVVTGRVQGVGFRAWVQTQARSLGLAGWARNVPDGSVMVAAEGAADVITAFERLLHQGPRHADVRSVTSSAISAGSGESATSGRGSSNSASHSASSNALANNTASDGTIGDSAQRLPQPFLILRD